MGIEILGEVKTYFDKHKLQLPIHLFSLSLAHAASPSDFWKPPATRNTRPDTSWSSTELQHSLVEWNLPIVPADTSSVHQCSPMFLALWQMTGHPCCLSNTRASLLNHMSCEADSQSKKTGFSHNRATKNNCLTDAQASSEPRHWTQIVLWF